MRKLGPALAVLGRAFDDLVVDVRDVADVGDTISAAAQIALHEVEDREHARVAQVDVVVDGDAADVHTNFAGNQRLERLLDPGQGVMDFEHAIRSAGAPFPVE